MHSTTRAGWRQHHELLQGELIAWSALHDAPLTPVHQKIVHTLDWLEMERFVGAPSRGPGAPECSRWALANAFVAKAVMGLEQTRQLIDRLQADRPLRRLLGFNARRKLPSEATFSRAFADFALTNVPQRVHEALVRSHLGGQLIGHIARDSSAIAARERPVLIPRAPKAKVARGRKRSGDARAAPRSRIPAQLEQSASQALADLPRHCSKGVKRDARGNRTTWIGYKLHLDVACCQVPVSAALTAASCHDNQVSVPLARLSAERVTSLYALMDSAYDSATLREFERSLGHVPIVAINPRSRPNPPVLSPLEVERFKTRTVVERAFGRLKDSLACDKVWVKGHAKVFCHAMFSVLALSAQALQALALEPPAPATG